MQFKTSSVGRFCVSLGFLLLSSLSFHSLLSLGAAAEGSGVSVEKLQVNGLDVYLINTHYGNELNLSVDVPMGSAHDDPVKYAGRAHLWEHVIHRGSKKYPGQAVFDEITAKIGARTNAYTASNRIYYHGTLHPQGFKQWATLLGAMVSEPAFAPEEFPPEKEVVMGEALDYQKRDEVALDASIFLNLMPGHPLAMYHVGTQAQLSAMTLDDLKELYFGNYGKMRVILAGNFDLKDAPARDEIVRVVQENFKAPEVPQEFQQAPKLSEKYFPPVTLAPGAPRMVELKANSGTRTLQLVFSVDSKVIRENRGGIEVLQDYLNLTQVGGLSDQLQKKGWITGMGCYHTLINNLGLVQVTFQLTEEGSKNRYEIPKYLFKTLEQLVGKGLDPELLAYLKLRNQQTYTQSVTEASKATETLAKNLQYSLPAEQLLDFDAQFGGVSDEQVRRLAGRVFDLNSMLGGYVGPEVESSEKGPVFDRPTLQLPLKDEFAAWSRIRYEHEELPGFSPIAPEIKKVKLTFSDPKVPLARSLSKPFRVQMKRTGLIQAAQIDLNSRSAGVALQLTPRRLKARDQVALNLTLNAWAEKYKGELDYLQSVGVPVSLQVNADGTLTLEAHGDYLAVPDAVMWVLEQFSAFAPGKEELRIASEEMAREFIDAEQYFSAALAARSAMRLADPAASQTRELEAIRKEFAGEAEAEVGSRFRSLSSRWDIAAAAAGNWSPLQWNRWLAEVREQIGPALTPHERKEREKSPPRPRPVGTFWRKLDAEAKGVHSYGWARLFAGPNWKGSSKKDGAAYQKALREFAAYQILIDVLSQEIFQTNRARDGLGYVHRMTPVWTGMRLDGVMMGETDLLKKGSDAGAVVQTGAERAPKIPRGWQEVLDRLRDGKISQEAFQRFQFGNYWSELMVPPNHGEMAGRSLSSLLHSGNATTFDAVSELYPSLELADFMKVAEKYLFRKPMIEVLATAERPPKSLLKSVACSRFLTSPQVIQR